MTMIIFSRLTLVKLHARCRGGALERAIATVVYRQGQHEGLEECTQARRYQEFPLARLAACVGHLAGHGRYNDGRELLGNSTGVFFETVERHLSILADLDEIAVGITQIATQFPTVIV